MARIQDEMALGPVEAECFRLAKAGEPVKAEPHRRVIPGDVVRFIVETVNSRAGPGGCSVDFQGWTVRGKIDLKGVAGLGYLSLQDCLIEDSLDIEFADLRALDLDGSTVGLLEGMRARIRGSVYMRKGFRALRGVDLSGAWIEGSLTCRGSTLGFDDAPVKDKDWDGDWEKHFPFEANPHAGPKERPFKNPFCLNLRHTTIGGTLYVGPKHQQEKDDRTGLCLLLGSVDLSGLRVREFVDHETTYEPIAGGAGDAPVPRTRHRLVLDGFEYDRFGTSSPKGARYRIGTWLALQPDAFAPPLSREDVTDRPLGEEFHPQPYEQLAKVLKAMGHDLDAKEVQFQRRLRQTLHSIEFQPPPAKPARTLLGPVVHQVRRAWHAAARTRKRVARVYGWVTGFGYKPINLVASIVGLVLINSLAINWAANVELVVPADEALADSAWWRTCRRDEGPNSNLVSQIVVGGHHINDCIKQRPPAGTAPTELKRFEEHPRFNGLFFSIESFFPVLDLNQRAHWSLSDRNWPGLLLTWWMAIYTMLGWVGTSLLVAGLFARFNQRGGD